MIFTSAAFPASSQGIPGAPGVPGVTGSVGPQGALGPPVSILKLVGWVLGPMLCVSQFTSISAGQSDRVVLDPGTL